MEEKTVKSLQALKSAEFRMERTTMEESDEELVEANSGKKGRSERGRRTRRKHIYHKRKRARKKSKKEELSEEKHEVSSVSTVELPGPRSESESVAQDDGESLFCVEREGKKLRAEAEVFIPNFFQQQQQPTIFIEEWWSKTVNYAIPYGHNSRALSVDSLTEEELTFVASTIGDDELHELSEYTTPIIHCAISDDQKNRLEFMRTELDGRKEIEKTEFYLAKKSQDWANWAVAAAEAERCRRLVALAELEEEARKERIRRQAWAVEAVAIEKRRQLGLDLLSTASNSRWWLEEVLGGGSGARDINSVKDDDYELVCPYACFGCTHVCPRSRLTEHLAHCCSAEGAFRAPNQSQRNKDQEEQISHCLSSVNDDRMKNEDETAHYLVVCPNAVMGCRVVCRRGVELQRHLDACPFSDSTRQNERAQREQLRAIVATQAEQERARRVDADFRATLASAAARAARRALGIDDTSTGTASAFDHNNENHQMKNSSGNNGRRTKQAAVIKKQQKAAMLALGGELRNWWEAQNENCETGRERRRQAIENVRCAVIQAFEDMAARLLGRASKKICAPVTVELFGSCAYGLDSENSDLDLVVRGWDQACTAVRGNATWVLHRLAQQLRGHASIKILKIIDRARVPVIKARVEIIPLHTNNDNHVLVDLSLATSSHTGLEAAGLCRSLLKSIPALAPTALALKRLLAQHGLNDPFTGGLPSYAVILMVFYSRLHSKHAETHLQHRRGHPFERSATLSDDSWRMNAFGQILKKTKVSQREEQEIDVIEHFTMENSIIPTANVPIPSSPIPQSITPTRDLNAALSKVYTSPRQQLVRTAWHQTTRHISPEARGEALAIELLAKGGFVKSDKNVKVDDFELAETLIEAVLLFGCDFTPQKEGFSVRHGGRRLVIDNGHRLVIAPHLRPAQSKAHRLKLDHNFLIEDPLDPTNNVGRASYHASRIFDVLKSHHDKLRAAMSKFDPTQSKSDDRSSAPLAGAGRPLLSSSLHDNDSSPGRECLLLPVLDDDHVIVSSSVLNKRRHSQNRPLLDAFFGHNALRTSPFPSNQQQEVQVTTIGSLSFTAAPS